MEQQLKSDPRISFIKNIVPSIVGKSYLADSKMMITSNNLLVIITLDTVMYIVDLSDKFPQSLPPIGLNFNDNLSIEGDYYCGDYFVLDKIQNYFGFYMNEIQIKPKIAYNPQLRDDENFEKLLNLKSGDGNNFYKMNCNEIGRICLLPMFSSLLSLNKSDKIGASIYDLLNGNLLVEMDIYKKKINKSYRMYYRIIDLSRKLV